MLDHIVIPEDVESIRSSSPVDKEECSPERHADGEHASNWRSREIPYVHIAEEHDDCEDCWNEEPFLEVIHPFEVDCNLIAVVCSDLLDVDEELFGVLGLLDQVAVKRVSVSFLCHSDESALRV